MDINAYQLPDAVSSHGLGVPVIWQKEFYDSTSFHIKTSATKAYHQANAVSRWVFVMWSNPSCMRTHQLDMINLIPLSQVAQYYALYY